MAVWRTRRQGSSLAAMTEDLIRRVANLILAFGQLAMPPLLFAAGFEAGAARTPIVTAPNPATPAGYAFAIWGVIFLGCAAYAVLQAVPGNATDPLFRRIGWWTAAGFLLCLLWLLAARFGPVWLTVPIIAAMLATLGTAFLIVARWPDPLGPVRLLAVFVPLAIYAGWLSAATFVNAADVLPGYGFDRFGLSPVAFGVTVVAAAGATALGFAIASRASLPYVAAVLWALAAIFVMARSMTEARPVALAALAGIGLLAAAAGAVRLVHGDQTPA